MADTNKKNETLDVEKERVASSTAYNVMGFVPVKSVFLISKKELQEAILEVAKAELDDIETITFEHDKNGNVNTFAWIRKDSKHLRDTSVVGKDTMIARPLSRFSPELKDFMNRFCPADQKKAFRNNEYHQPLKAILVSLPRFLKILFDVDGSEYAKMFNERKTRCEIYLQWHFRADRNSQYGTLSYAEIIKSVKADFLKHEPKTVQNGRF